MVDWVLWVVVGCVVGWEWVMRCVTGCADGYVVRCVDVSLDS